MREERCREREERCREREERCRERRGVERERRGDDRKGRCRVYLCPSSSMNTVTGPLSDATSWMYAL